MMKQRCVMRGARSRPSGFTLLEVMVVMAVLGLITGVTALAFGSLRAPRESDVARELRRARSQAIRTGRPAVTVVNHALRTTHVLFLPDGGAIGSGADPLTGAPIDAPK
jgi:prepilin-type N-terminal cleavage/methylation domain-containing protein